MCQKHNGFVGSLFEEMERAIDLDPGIGSLCLGHLPPRSAAIGEKDAFFAAGSMVSFLTNCGFITEGEDIFNQRFTSEVAAGFLVKTTIEIINIPQGIHGSIHVNHIGIIEASHHVNN